MLALVGTAKKFLVDDRSKVDPPRSTFCWSWQPKAKLLRVCLATNSDVPTPNIHCANFAEEHCTWVTSSRLTFPILWLNGIPTPVEIFLPVSTRPQTIMLHPVHSLNSRYFYPIGNTPAVSLLSHQPPEKECVNMLLLGCGDERNILYTVFSNQNSKLSCPYHAKCRTQTPLKSNAWFLLAVIWNQLY